MLLISNEECNYNHLTDRQNREGKMTEKKMATRKTVEETPEIDIIEIKRGVANFCVIGRSPLICNRMSSKSKQTLLLPPPGKKNAAEKASTLKHDPLTEYRDSPYRNMSDGPTRIQGLGSWFKGSMKTAALDHPHTKKTQIGRQVYVLGDRVDIYGTPQMFMAVTRNSDIAHTPDIRTRAILPRWACFVSISYAIPLYTAGGISNLLAAGGNGAAVGDWRIEKGGSYGRFELVDRGDPEFSSILKEGREAQDEALENPVFYDDETCSLFTWFNEELVRRNRGKGVSIVAA
jgi:hypothetical protein